MCCNNNLKNKMKMKNNLLNIKNNLLKKINVIIKIKYQIMINNLNKNKK